MTQDPATMKRSAVNGVIPAHEILNCVAAAITADQLPGLDLAEVKATLEYAAAAVRRQNGYVAHDNSQDLAITATELNLNKVLLVDDVEQNRTLMKHMVTRSGFTPIVAVNGHEAFELACTELPALIVSDIMMPGVTGLDLLEMLQADERTKDIAVILVTAHYRDSKRVSQGLNMGAYDYIQRPFSLDEFVSRINVVIRIKRAEAEIQRQARVVSHRNRGLNLVNELALAVNSLPDVQNIFASSVKKLSQLLDADIISLLMLDYEKQQVTVNIASCTQQYVSVVLDSDELSEEQIPDIALEIINQNRDALGLDFSPDDTTMPYIPLYSRERQIVGGIVIVNKQGQSLSNADWVLLQSAGNIIAVAIENTRLLENAQQQVDDLIALNEIGRALSSTLELDQTFERTTRYVQNLLHSEGTSLWVLDKAGKNLKLMAASDGKAAFKANPCAAIYYDIAAHVAQTGEVFLSADIATEKDRLEYAPVPDAYQPRSMLGVPAMFEDKIIGVILSSHRKTNRFNQNHLRLCYPIANSVGISLKNAQLFAEVQDFNNFLEQMVETRTQQLAEEKEKIEAILSSMADGLLVLDANHHILTANAVAEKMLNFELPSLVGHPIDSERLETPLWRCISNIARDAKPTTSVTVDIPIPQSDEKLSIQAHSAKVQSEAGQVIGTVIVLTDITALKEVERMKSRFMAGITHELKTPLAVIQLHSSNLLAYYNRLPDEKKRELLQSIQNQVKLLRQLIENILHLSRMDSGMVKIKQQPVGIIKLINQIVTDLRPLAEEKQITLNWRPPRAETTVMASASQLERVMRNLIDNAIKYTPHNKAITVEFSTEYIENQEMATIKVIDTGIGIPPEHQPRIFERFYRVDPSHTVPGTGLGLSIVKEIVNAHQGNIVLKSVPGAGSMFIVTLPVIV